jgi:hypothetical protein
MFYLTNSLVKLFSLLNRRFVSSIAFFTIEAVRRGTRVKTEIWFNDRTRPVSPTFLLLHQVLFSRWCGSFKLCSAHIADAFFCSQIIGGVRESKLLYNFLVKDSSISQNSDIGGLLPSSINFSSQGDADRLSCVLLISLILFSVHRLLVGSANQKYGLETSRKDFCSLIIRQYSGNWTSSTEVCVRTLLAIFCQTRIRLLGLIDSVSNLRKINWKCNLRTNQLQIQGRQRICNIQISSSLALFCLNVHVNMFLENLYYLKLIKCPNLAVY